MKRPRIATFGLASLAGISAVTPAFALVNIDYTPVGNAGNAEDPMTGYSAMAYTYAISKYETTISQCAVQENIVPTVTDPNPPPSTAF